MQIEYFQGYSVKFKGIIKIIEAVLYAGSNVDLGQIFGFMKQLRPVYESNGLSALSNSQSRFRKN